MGSELQELRSKAEELARLAVGRPEAPKAMRLAERLAAGHFLIAVVGEFKRGKSTLVNALVGEPVLPTGVLPLTAIPTELQFGTPSTTVVYLDGHTEQIERDRIPAYVTESDNPTNTLGVARVELRGEWPLLEPGVVLVDTPGIASANEHNTEAGRTALLDADGAILVLSAEAPISERETELLRVLGERHSPAFFVLNKADHLTREELTEVGGFVAKEISTFLPVPPRIFAIDARSALRGGPNHLGSRSEFDELAAALSTFIADDLTRARVLTARHELARLGNSLSDGIAIEQAARQVAAGRLGELVSRFVTEATDQARGFDDDKALLERDVIALRNAASERLSEFAKEAPKEYGPALERASKSTPRSRLEDDLRSLLQSAVEESFERCRADLLAWVSDRWHVLTDRFRERVEQRVEAARQAAAYLFEVPLPRLTMPEITEQADRFSFLFVRVGSTSEPLGRVASRLVPGRMARPRALTHATAELASEFDKHAGRARWDLAQRLDAARMELERAMREELDDSINAIIEAAHRARQWQEEDRKHQVHKDEVAGRLQALGSSLTALAESAP